MAHTGFLPDHRPAQAGLTRVEIAVMVLAIGVLLAVLAPIAMGPVVCSQAAFAKVEMKDIGSVLASYQHDNGQYPSTRQGLDALARQPTGEPAAWHWHAYLKEVPRDAWGNPYHYTAPGAASGYDLTSYGADGLPGGVGAAADISLHPTMAEN